MDDLFGVTTYFVRLFVEDVQPSALTTYADMAAEVTGTTLVYSGFQTNRDGEGNVNLFYQAALVPDSWRLSVLNPAGVGNGAVKMYGDAPLVWRSSGNDDVTVYGYYVFRSLSSDVKKLAWSQRVTPQLLHTQDLFPLRIKFGLKTVM